MTLHKSKGLEFDIVFPIGLASRTPAEDEERAAEKQRLLYVALTRAKRRLYLALWPHARRPKPGGESAWEAFTAMWQSNVKALYITSSPTMRSPVSLSGSESPHVVPPPLLPPAPQSRHLFSFSSLARGSVRHAPRALEEAIPSGSAVGTAFHEVLEQLITRRLFAPFHRCAARALLEETILAPYADGALEIVEAVWAIPIEGVPLADVAPRHMHVEAEFLYPLGVDLCKGFIDLIFEHEGRVYIVDWKSNSLGEYESGDLEEAMQTHDYHLQAKLYTAALRRHIAGRNELSFGGVYYLFIRGAPDGKGLYHCNSEDVIDDTIYPIR